MPQEEIYNTRDRTYSAWHRRLSTRRFIGIEKAQTLAMIDLDASLYVEYDDKSKEPLALIETAQDVGQSRKVATVTRNLARRASALETLPAVVLLYTKSQDRKNPADRHWPDIDAFRVRRIWPGPETGWYTATPEQWANWLLQLRTRAAASLDEFLDQLSASEGSGIPPRVTGDRDGGVLF